MTPSPRERRQTALRWLGPKLQSDVRSNCSVEKGSWKYEHPVEDQWHERGDHETKVDHGVGREGEPTVLSTLGDITTFGLLGSRNGTTRIFSSDTNTKEESMGPQIIDRRQPSRGET